MKNGVFAFNHFKQYASFCLLKNFEELNQAYIQSIREANQKYIGALSHLGELESNHLFQERLGVFLKSAINDCVMDEVEVIASDWKAGNLPGNVNKFSIKPSDILLSFYTCRNVLLNYISRFTTDLEYGLSIINELDIFILFLEEKFFKIYLEVQKEFIKEKYEALNKIDYILCSESEEKSLLEEKLRREINFSQAVINNTNNGILAFDSNLNITVWNTTLERLNGLSKDDVIGKNIFELFPMYKEREEGNALQEVLNGKEFKLGGKAYAHNRGFYEVYMMPLINGKNEVTGGLSFIYDLTHWKMIEEKVKLKDSLLKETQEVTKLGSWEWIARTNKITWSDEAYKILGFDPDEIQISPDLFFDFLYQEDKGKIKAIIEDSFYNLKPFSIEVKVKRKDGNIIIILVKGEVMAYNNKIPYKMMGIVWDITDKKIIEDELRHKNIELQIKNDELKNIEIKLTETNNELEQRVCDRTRQLSWMNDELNLEVLERRKMEETLEYRNQELLKINDDLDNFVYAASHDLKSPISNIEGLVILLNLERQNMGEDTKRIIDLINNSILRLKDTIDDLAEITRVQKNADEEISMVDLNGLLEEVKLSIESSIISSRASIIFDGCDFPNVRFSKANLKSILFNLISNSIKYKHPQRDPEIIISCIREEDYMILSVADNGLGLSCDQKDKVFTMFKRFHDHVEGSGIGLYLVKRIVDNSSGKIEVESEEGVGSTFKIYLKVGY